MTTTRVTKNQVSFRSRGRTKMGWIHKSTPMRYLIWYKEHGQDKTVWRYKDEVSFVKNGRRQRRPKNPYPPPARRNVSSAVVKAARLSKLFHSFDPRKLRAIDLTWPKALTCLGVCSQLNYLSDKNDGKLREYFHRFGKATVYAGIPKQGRGKGLLIIHGNFEVKSEGIIG